MRRGSHAVEFGLVLPLLLVLASGIVDLGSYLVTADALAAAVADGARTGALVDLADDPLAHAEQIAQENFLASQALGSASFTASLDGAPPDRTLVVVGTTDVVQFFGFLDLPGTVSHEVTIRLATQ